MKQETAPLITVVMPAYNARAYIEEAVASVQAQTEPRWELIVLDDGSTDGTRELIAALAQRDGRIRPVYNEANMGVARTRNRGFEMARGKYVALLDSDDAWQPEKLARQIDLAEQTGADIIYCGYSIVDEHGEKASPDFVVPEHTDFNAMLTLNVIGCSTALMTRAVTDQYRFTTDFFHEDYVFWLQLLRDGKKAAGLPEPLMIYRRASGSRSFNKVRAAMNRWRIYRDYLGLSFFKSVDASARYALRGLKKHRRC